MKKIKSLLLALCVAGLTLAAVDAGACPNCPHAKGKCACAAKKEGKDCECAKKCDCAKKKGAKCDCANCECGKKCGCAKKAGKK
jgi:hypothetical protein